MVGDLVIDEHRIGTVARLSREAPLPIIEQESELFLPGAAGNLTVNLCAIGARASLLGVVGQDELGQRLVEMIAARGADTSDILAVAGQRTPSKLRIWASGDRQEHNYQVARVDVPAGGELAPTELEELIGRLDRAIGDHDALIFSDYEGGVVDPSVVEVGIKSARNANIMLLADSHGGFERFRGFGTITPNQPEAESYLNRRFSGPADALACGGTMRAELDCQHLVLTMGGQGLCLFERDRPAIHIPAVPIRGIADSTGAGDSVAAVFATARIVGASSLEAAELANCAGAAVVATLGVTSVTCGQIMDVVTAAASN